MDFQNKIRSNKLYTAVVNKKTTNAAGVSTYSTKQIKQNPVRRWGSEMKKYSSKTKISIWCEFKNIFI